MMRPAYIAVLVALFIGPFDAGIGFAAAPRIALVIGNSEYRISPRLPNPANDARLMAETLRDLGFDVIERIDADQETMQLATFELQDRLVAAGKDAVGLFYYAGHGVQVGGQNYLIPLNTDIKQEREVAIKAVSAGFVLGQMEAAGNRMNFVVLDACRNNPLTRSFRSATRGLARMDAPRGSLVAYSTGPGEVAADGMGANSPHTLALAEAMRTQDVPAEKMFKLVRNSVMAATGGEQTPWEESSLTGADFYFSVDVSVAVEAPAAPSITETAATTQQETLFWETIKESSDPRSFEAYLAQYPSGAFSVLARLKLEQLGETRTAAVIPPPEPETSVQPAVGVYPRAYKPGDTFGEFCTMLDRFVQMAPSDFRSILGQDDDESGIYQVREWMPGADECWFAMDGNAYWCSWEVGEGQQLSRYRNISRATIDCYPGWEVRDDTEFVFIQNDFVEIYITYGGGDIDISIEPNETQTAAVVPLPEPAIPSLVQEIVGIYPQPQSVFRNWLKDGGDCAFCPEMVVAPVGSFKMGSPASEEGRYDDEGPLHGVDIERPFAIGRYEVTRGAYAKFVADSGHSTGKGCWYYDFDENEFVEDENRSWRDPGFSQSDDEPVLCVNWNDAQAYVSWLSRKTGEQWSCPIVGGNWFLA